MKKRLLIILVVAMLCVGCEATDITGNTQGAGEMQKPEEEHKHEYTESITTEATCETDGVKTFTCECGDSYTEAITATGHNYVEVTDSAKEATCDADGKEVDTKCSLCEKVVAGAVITAKGHSYGEYVYNNDASTSADGTETAICEECGGTDTRTKEGTKIVVTKNWWDDFEFNTWYDMGDYIFCIAPTMEEIAVCNEEFYKYLQLLSERYPDRHIVYSACHGGANGSPRISSIGAYIGEPGDADYWCPPYPWL